MVGATVAVVLVAGAAYAVSDVAGEPDCGVTLAPTLDDAVRLAVECGHEVTALDSLGTRSSMVATPRGTVRALSEASAVRTDVSGEWEPVDPTVVRDEGTGELRVASPVSEIVFDPADGSGFVTIASGDGAVSIDVPVELGEPVFEGSTVSWDVVGDDGVAIDGVRVAVQVHDDASGVTPLIVVDDPQAYAALERAAEGPVGFEISTSGGLSVDPEASGAFEVLDSKGAPVLSSAEPLQWDSSGGVSEQGVSATASPTPADAGDTLPAAERADGDVVTPMDVEVVDDTSVVVSADPAMAADPNTTWPVVLDPVMSGWALNDWIVVRDASGWGSKYGSGSTLAGNEGVGYCSPTATSSPCSQIHRSRMYWHFDAFALPYLEPADVVSAEFRVKGTHSWSCSQKSLDVYLTGGFTPATTWSNQPSWTSKLDTQTPTHYTSCAGNAMDEWDVIAAARKNAGTSSDVTLGLRAASEVTGSWWRYDMGSAQLEVEFNRAPKTPTGRTMTFGTRVQSCGDTPLTNDATPMLTVTLNDVDSVAGDERKDDRISAIFEVRTSSSSETVWSYEMSSTVTSGGTLSKTVMADTGGKLESGSYRWRARAVDRDGLSSSWTEWCAFKVDTDGPDAPTLTPVPQGTKWLAGPVGLNAEPKYVEVDAEYWDKGVDDGPPPEAGGVNQLGCFVLRWEAPDVESYTYSFKDLAPRSVYANQPAMVPGVPYGTVCMPDEYPEAAGKGSVTVYTTDLAGNPSGKTVYAYDVATAREDGVWSFDTKETPVLDESVRSAGEAEGAGALTVTDGIWVEGPHTLFSSRDGDYALSFNGRSTQAVTAHKVFDTEESFVIAAHVNPASVSTARAVVSQDGGTASGWRVGLATSGCPLDLTSCWAFSAYDSLSKATTTVRSGVAPVAEQWTQLTAAYDATTGKLRMWVCDIGTPASPKRGEPIATSRATAPTNMQAGVGPVAVGRAQRGAAPVDWWKGEIDNVRLFKGEVVAEAKIRRMCQGAEANQFGEGIDALDPTSKVGQ